MSPAEYAADYEPPTHTPAALVANGAGGRVAYVGFDADDAAVAAFVEALACRDAPPPPSPPPGAGGGAAGIAPRAPV